MVRTKPRLQDVHRCKETNKPEKLSPMKNKKITEMKTTEMKKELQANQISCAKESIGKQLEQL
jgi:hypothetical protein